MRDKDILKALNEIIDPQSGRGLDDAGLVQGLVVTPGRVGFMIEVASEVASLYGPVRLAAEKRLLQVEGVKTAHVVLTSPLASASAKRAVQPKAALSAAARAQNAPKPQDELARPDFVGRVVAVASGKGGVGKSSLSLGLALGFAALGWKTGWLDADIYGPSGPMMLGLSGAPQLDFERRMIPAMAYGLKVNSIGFLMDTDQAMIWRGPMASQATTQLLTQTRWGESHDPLDVLIIDTPPGTGDVHLTLSQKTKIDGAVIVTTPQDMAVLDARRAITGFEKLDIPVMGLIENMSGLIGPDGNRIDLFGRGGGRKLANGCNIRFLGEIPIDTGFRIGGDEGRPKVALEPESELALRFQSMAQALIDQWM